jgi:hypothetical protein
MPLAAPFLALQPMYGSSKSPWLFADLGFSVMDVITFIGDALGELFGLVMGKLLHHMCVRLLFLDVCLSLAWHVCTYCSTHFALAAMQCTLFQQAMVSQLKHWADAMMQMHALHHFASFCAHIC